MATSHQPFCTLWMRMRIDICIQHLWPPDREFWPTLPTCFDFLNVEKWCSTYTRHCFDALVNVDSRIGGYSLPLKSWAWLKLLSANLAVYIPTVYPCTTICDPHVAGARKLLKPMTANHPELNQEPRNERWANCWLATRVTREKKL